MAYHPIVVPNRRWLFKDHQPPESLLITTANSASTLAELAVVGDIPDGGLVVLEEPPTSGDAARRLAALQEVLQVVQHEHAHGGAGLQGGAAQMRQQHGVFQL